MAKGKAADKSGIVVEMLQAGGCKLAELMATTFSQLLLDELEPPDSWKQSLITVLFKKGDAKHLENYRPITILPILYKVFARLLHARMRTVLENAQSPDQAGFRQGFSCEDHLFTVTQIIERFTEFNLPLWICAVDFKKAFDTVEHQAIWDALVQQGVNTR